ncbi:MAG: GNAT family N-acetyltransferase [Actinomycetaceae bacterium]|nr:GNAT family N-acetyltransferase [Actinomycetaceae bacterium]
MIDYRTDRDIDREQLAGLYDSVGWSAYTRDPARLHQALAGSLWHASAWDGLRLVGLIRVVGDGEVIAYVQDILVRPSHQRQGIGARLFAMAGQRFAAVRQLVLMTDDDPATAAFYRSVGLKAAGDVGLRAFVRLL